MRFKAHLAGKVVDKQGCLRSVEESSEAVAGGGVLCLLRKVKWYFDLEIVESDFWIGRLNRQWNGTDSLAHNKCRSGEVAKDLGHKKLPPRQKKLAGSGEGGLNCTSSEEVVLERCISSWFRGACCRLSK